LHHAGCCGNVWRFSVTEVCREWTQPDGLHFRGKCGNEFMPKTGADGCNICTQPIFTPTPCDLYGSGSTNALAEWRGQYFTGPLPFSVFTYTAADFIDTWHPFFRLNIPSGVFSAEPGPAFYCPAEYNGDWVMYSGSHCENWIAINASNSSYLLGMAVGNAPQCGVLLPQPNRFVVSSTVMTTPSGRMTWVELQIAYKIFNPGTLYTIRCRTTPQPSHLYFNMNSTFEFLEARSSVADSPWLAIGGGPITITPF